MNQSLHYFIHIQWNLQEEARHYQWHHPKPKVFAFLVCTKRDSNESLFIGCGGESEAMASAGSFSGKIILANLKTCFF